MSESCQSTDIETWTLNLNSAGRTCTPTHALKHAGCSMQHAHTSKGGGLLSNHDVSLDETMSQTLRAPRCSTWWVKEQMPRKEAAYHLVVWLSIWWQQMRQRLLCLGYDHQCRSQRQHLRKEIVYLADLVEVTHTIRMFNLSLVQKRSNNTWTSQYWVCNVLVRSHQ